MKFYDYVNVTCNFNRWMGNNFTREYVRHMLRASVSLLGPQGQDMTAISYSLSNTMVIEDLWNESERPYYDVYPSVAEFISDLNLNFDASQLKMPHGLKALLLKFPIDHEPNYILFTISKEDDITAFSYVVNKGYGMGSIGMMQYSHPVTNGDTLENSLKNTFEQVINSEKNIGHDLEHAHKRWSEIVKIFKIISSVCLIGEDPELIEPQVLTNDINKVNPDTINKLIEKAKKRGKFGFTFGKSLEQIPHLRRPHMYWQAYGPKHSLRRYRTRKGSVIHKEKITNVPTGFEENESVHT